MSIVNIVHSRSFVMYYSVFWFFQRSKTVKAEVTFLKQKIFNVNQPLPFYPRRNSCPFYLALITIENISCRQMNTIMSCLYRTFRARLIISGISLQ